MIPKIIHYFGGHSLSAIERKCIHSWEKYMPDYKVIEWNEYNFDMNCNDYVKEAYTAKKWAFVSDYVRLSVLYKYGGIYMDTDVEVIKNMDGFLGYNAFAGFEDLNLIQMHLVGAEKKNEWIEILLLDYSKRHFIENKSKYDLTPITLTITRITRELYTINLDNTFQIIGNGIAIYPKEYFAPKGWSTGKTNITVNTHAIHHYRGSWFSFTQKVYINLIRVFGFRFGNLIFKSMKLLKNIKLFKIMLS